MDILANLLNRIKTYPRPVSVICVNERLYNQLSKIIEEISNNDYNYYSSLGLENIMLVIDNTLQDNMYELK